MMKTKTIARHEITLEKGIRYWASRPWADGRETFDVTISPVLPAKDDWQDDEVVIRNLTYDQANELLGAFNTGKSSFDGRIW